MKNSASLKRSRNHSLYEKRLKMFKHAVDKNVNNQKFGSDASGASTHDLLSSLGHNSETREALTSYMDQLDKAFDISGVDAVQPFLPLSSSEKLEDIGLKFISLSPEAVQHLLTQGYQTILEQDGEHTHPEHSADWNDLMRNILHETKDGGDIFQYTEKQNATKAPETPNNQIRIDRADVVQRVLKARLKDPSVTVVSGPKTAQ